MPCSSAADALPVQGSLWDVAWSADSSYVAGITTRAVGEVAKADATWQSMLYYWRRDGSLACTAEIDYAVSKVFVDPGNHAYVVTVGTVGKVWPVNCQQFIITQIAVPSLQHTQYQNNINNRVHSNKICSHTMT
jgi:hypothetical protein